MGYLPSWVILTLSLYCIAGDVYSVTHPGASRVALWSPGNASSARDSAGLQPNVTRVNPSVTYIPSGPVDGSHYACRTCGNIYTHFAIWQEHENKCSSKAYICPVCQKRFTQSGTLNRHVKKIHDL